MVKGEHLLKLRALLEGKIEAVSKAEGPAGADGKDGKDGKAGPAGKVGPAGKDGKDGVDGKDGASCVCIVPDEIVDLKVEGGNTYSGTRSYGVQGTSELRTRLDNLERLTTLVDTTAGDVTETLPAASASEGQILRYKKTAGANVVILSAAEGIDGSTTASFSRLYESVSVQSDGTQWWIV